MMKYFIYIFAIGIVFMTVGCHHDPAFVISLHEYALNDLYAGSRLKRGAMTQNIKSQADISTIPFIDYHDFLRGEVYFLPERPKRFGIRLYADEFGIHRLIQQSNGRDGMEYAIIIDGFYVGEGKYNMKQAEAGIVELPPLWGEHEARIIADHVEKNFELSELNYFSKKR